MMFGFACDETSELMPAPIISRIVWRDSAHQESGRVTWLRPDAKSQVSVQYEDGKQCGSPMWSFNQHAADPKHKCIRDYIIKNSSRKVLPAELLDRKTEFLINTTGRFVTGGPQGDTGLTGRRSLWTLTAVWAARLGRVQRQRSVQGGPERGLHGPIRGQEHRGFGPGDSR